MAAKNYEGIDHRLSAHVLRLLKTHETLLRDAERNRVFYDALRRSVSEGSAVLDIGSGTGIWAIAAAKLGARRVVAVERDELMVGVIRMLAVEQGVGDRVEAVWGSSGDVSFKKEFDIVISETIGYLGYEEDIVSIMGDARRRFLKKGGMSIPETVSLYAAAGRLKVRQESTPAGMPFDFGVLRRLNLNSPLVLRSRSDVELLTEPACLIETDLRNATGQPDLQNLTAAWDLEDSGGINCVVVWVEAQLTEGVRLSTRETTSWRPMIYRIDAVGPGSTRLEFGLSIAPRNTGVAVAWSARTGSVLREYSPDLAATEMIASARTDGHVISRGGRVFLKPARRSGLPITVRPAAEGDKDFLFQLYCESRQSEVEQFGWGEAETEAFLRMQYGMRERSYEIQFADAEQSVILFENEKAGTLIVAREDGTITLADIAVSPNYRNRGIASHLVRQLQNEASEKGGSVTLHVEKINRTALRLYEKLGFVVFGETDLQYEMRWMP
jgi:ribosomal protein S18 acetylase RimI-like enzyme